MIWLNFDLNQCPELIQFITLVWPLGTIMMMYVSQNNPKSHTED